MIKERLEKLNIILPPTPKPAGMYTPVSCTNNLTYVSGQIPIKSGNVIYTGKVSDENIEEAKESAKLCIINCLAQLESSVKLESIKRIIRISGYVNSTPQFTMQHKVMDAASKLLNEIFIEMEGHSRIAIGVPSLPLDAMTEIDMIVEIKS